MPITLKTKPRKTIDEIVLPTGGYPYGKSIPNGRITVKAFDWNSERLLFDPEVTENITKQHMRYVQVMKQIGEFPTGFEPWNIITQDALYMLLKARSLSYGEVHSLEASCPECGHKEKIDLVIPEHLPVNRYPSDFSGSLPYKTQDDNEVTLRFLTLKQELDTENLVRNKLTVKLITKDQYDQTVEDQVLAAHVTAVNGDPVTTTDEVLEWLRKSPGERDEIRSYLSQVAPGISNKIPIKCEKCGHHYTRLMLMGPQFFRPQRRADVGQLPPGIRLGVFGKDERREVASGS